jgi:exocyst complex component 2
LICGCDCLLSAEWKSRNKNVARSGPGKGRGDIIVRTASGGQGTSTVQFRGYHETIGPLKESAVWVEEAPVQNLGWGSALSSSSIHIEDPLGLSVEANELVLTISYCWSIKITLSFHLCRIFIFISTNYVFIMIV